MDKHISSMTVAELNTKLAAVSIARHQATKDGDKVLWHQLYDLGDKLDTECARRAKEGGCEDVAQKQFGIVL
jgi:hypothetical protein